MANSVQKATWIRYALAVAAGLLLAASFPNLGIAGLAWVAPGCILFVAFGFSGGQAFRIGYVAGMAHYLASLHWLLFIPFPIGAAAGWLALSAYLALYPALWVWLCWRLFPNQIASKRNHLDATGRIDQFLATPVLRRMVWSLGCAVIWVALEMVVVRFLTGFPWNLLGASQYQILPVIQIASITGIYGVSLLLVWFSVSLVSAFLNLVNQPTRTRGWPGDLIVPLLAVAAAAAYGVRRTTQPKPFERTVSVALVQPSIPQTLIWDPNENTNRFNQLLELSERALAAKPDLLIWPEAAVPNMLRYEPDNYESITNLLARHKVWMILGADDAMPRLSAAEKREFDYYNSSFLITPAGELAMVYRKRKLVIFGEYVPLARWLPFLRHLTPIGGEFTPGDKPTPFIVPELDVKTSVLICFEDTFPHLAREYVEHDTDFLLNLTNNGWFGESAAQWQHAANAVFRAVENGLPLVRCANNGLTCWVDARGAMHEVYYPGTKDIYGAGFKVVKVPLLAAGETRNATVYRRYGDWLGWTCVGFTFGMTMGSLRFAKSKRDPGSKMAGFT